MLSAEKAKLKSTCDKTNNQIHNEMVLNKKLNQTLGTAISLKINDAIDFIFPEGACKEFIADFKKSWFMVSHMLVKDMRNKINARLCFTPGTFLSLRRLKRQI